MDNFCNEPRSYPKYFFSNFVFFSLLSFSRYPHTPFFLRLAEWRALRENLSLCILLWQVGATRKTRVSRLPSIHQFFSSFSSLATSFLFCLFRLFSTIKAWFTVIIQNLIKKFWRSFLLFYSFNQRRNDK